MDDIDRLCSTLSKKDAQHVRGVWQYVKSNLSNVIRRSNESYAQHGLEVALTVKEATNDPALIIVALIHDILMHENGQNLLNKANISKNDKELAKRMHLLRRLHIDSKTEDLDKFISAFMDDERLLTLRMAHRLNDIRCIDRFEQTLRKEIAKEALHMYSTIAGRLGFHAWRYEMEDICFEELYPAKFSFLQECFDNYKEIDELSLKQTAHFLKKQFRKADLKAQIESRIKSNYSTYRKMLLKNRKFESLTDRIALRIIVENTSDCYVALGLIHTHMHPIPGKLKDYIGAPKENGYQSIHTVVYPLPGISEQPIEIQIRTSQMHQACEYGPAAHSDYKKRSYDLGNRITRVSLFKNLEMIRAEAPTPKQFEVALRKYFNDDQIAVFDDKNHLYHLKAPATALDFAYHTYPKKFAQLREVKINGRIMKYDTVLKNGDIIELSFSRIKLVTTEWSKACNHKNTKKAVQIKIK